MKTTLRASIAVISAVVVLAISAMAAATAGPVPLPTQAKEDGVGAAGTCLVGTTDCNDTPGTPMPGDGMAMCVEGVPDCNDMGLGGGSVDGSDGSGVIGSDPSTGSGGGATGSTGSPGDVTCGEVVEGDGPDGTVSYTPCDTDEPPAPAEPVITEPTPGMADVRARTFDSATVGDDGRTVSIDFYSGVEPCSVLDHIDVVETANTVTITLYEGYDPSVGDVVCIDIAVAKRAIITLDAPLGDRRIVDGAA